MGEGNKRIVVARHIFLDVTPVFQNSGKQKLSELFQSGKLLKVGKVMMCTGDAVSNIGLGLKCLGADVTLMVKIGNDYFGDALKDMINAHGCESYISQASGENMPYITVLMPKKPSRFFLHDPGCNNTFDYAGVDFEKVGEMTHFHSGYPPIMHRFYLDDGEELVRFFKKVKSMGLTASLDLTAVDLGSGVADMGWVKILERVLPYVDLFAPSVEELGYTLDRPLYCKWQETTGGENVMGILSFKGDVELLAARTLSMGTRYVLLKRGAVGIYLKIAPESVWEEALSEFTEWNDISHFEDSYVPDCALSEAGTGNTSIAASIKAMSDGCELPECIRPTAAMGASCVTTCDALSGLPPFEELRQKMGAGWEKQSITRPWYRKITPP